MRIEVPTRGSSVFVTGFVVDFATGLGTVTVETPNDVFGEYPDQQPVQRNIVEYGILEISEYTPAHFETAEDFLAWMQSRVIPFIQSYYGG